MEDTTQSLSDPNLLCHDLYFAALSSDKQNVLRTGRAALLPQNTATGPAKVNFKLFECLGIEPITNRDWWMVQTLNITSLKIRWGVAWFDKAKKGHQSYFHWDLIHTIHKYAKLYVSNAGHHITSDYGRINYYHASLWIQRRWPGVALYANTFPYYD